MTARWPSDIDSMVRVASALANPTRAKILFALQGGPMAVNALSAALGLAQPLVSFQVARLRNAGIVSSERAGRSRLYAIGPAGLTPLAEGLRTLAGPPGSVRRRPIAVPGPDAPGVDLRRARTCYEHLGGSEAVGLLDAMLARKWILPESGSGRMLRVTELGRNELGARGVNVTAAVRSRRMLAFGCLDWSERRWHLGGTLGRSVRGRLESGGFIRRGSGRAVRIRRPLASWVNGARRSA